MELRSRPSRWSPTRRSIASNLLFGTPTIQRIYGHVSIDQTLHYVGVDQEEMAEGFAVFNQHMRANYSEMSMSASQRQTAF